MTNKRVPAILNRLARLDKLPKPKGMKYRQAVNEEGFEKWMYWGSEYAKVLKEQIARAKKEGDRWYAKYWQDVLHAARACDTPENRIKRASMGPSTT